MAARVEMGSAMMAAVGVRAVLLDSGGVLIRPVIGTWFPPPVFGEVLAEHGLTWTEDALSAALDIGMTFLNSVHHEPLADETAELAIFTNYYEVLLSELGLDPSVAGEIAHRSALRLPVEPYEWTEPFLAAVRDLDMRVVIVSDAWPSLRRFYRELGLDHLVDGMAISAELGCTKPDPRMYRRGLELAGCEPADAVFVDDWPGNVEGAAQLGVRSYCLAGHPDARHTGSMPLLRDLRELLDHL